MQTVREGDVTIRVPEQLGAGTSDTVFFNPSQELNRDLTITALNAYRDQYGAVTYCDAMTATGIRGLRAAKADWDVTCYDIDPEAVALTRANFRANNLDGSVQRRNANTVLHQHRYDIVDIDPYGSPIPFADAAFRGTQDLLCVTATDTAPLCGAHFTAGIRRYSAVPRNTEYHPEMGCRILVSALARTGARYDVGITPLLTHATRHYVRTYLALDRGATPADASVNHLGYVHHCWACRYRHAETASLPDPPAACPACGSDNVETAGPLWIAPLNDPEFLDSATTHLAPNMGTIDRARKLLATLSNELDTPTHYDQHRLCKLWSRSAGPMDEFLEAIRAAGYAASRTHYGGTTFKTDADVTTIKEVTA